MKINIEKKHLYISTALIILFFSILFVIAQSSTPNPGHSANELDLAPLYINTINKMVGIGNNPWTKFDVDSGYGKTDTSWRNVFAWSSNDASNQFVLQGAMKGGASQADRAILLQTAEDGVANAGAISLQPNGGNVGIGTTSPGAKLDVRDEAGTPAAKPVIFINRPNNLAAPDPSLAGLYIKDHQSNYPFHIVSLPSGTPLFTIKGDGNVGIGTVNPQGKIHIEGSSIGASILVQNTAGGGFRLYSYDNNGGTRFRVWDGNTENFSDKLVIKANGNVGIGTINSNAKLDVNGDIKTYGSTILTGKYPVLVGMDQFLLSQGNDCWGYVCGDSGGRCDGNCDGWLKNKFIGNSYIHYAPFGYIHSAFNTPGRAAYGYFYAFFLNNQGAAKTISLTYGTCNDVGVYLCTASVSSGSFGSCSLIRHRTAGNADGGLGCPCSSTGETVSLNVPSGGFRIIIFTRGSDCTGYLAWPKDIVDWISGNGLQIDGNSLLTYLGKGS